MPYADVAEGNRAAYACADGFGESFFGGEVFGKVVDGFACLREFEQFLDCRKIENDYGIKPSDWQKALNDIIGKLD